MNKFGNPSVFHADVRCEANAVLAGATNITGSLTIVGSSVIKKIVKTVGVASFTDGGSTSGTYALTDAIPIGATVLCSKVREVTGFAGDTTAVMTIGDGSDADRYNTSTINVFTTAANGVATGVPSGVQYHDTAKYPTLTVTGGADFTSIKSNGLGSVTVEIDYIA